MSTQAKIRIPISTLTGEPCTGHDPSEWCVECVPEGCFRLKSLAPDTEEETR